jgi:DNA invertase Pin-like site-specific DNA recombinase
MNALEKAMARGKLVGYVRVSSLDQNTERQLDGIKVDKLFTEKASGKDANRPQLQACLSYLREDDTLIVHSMDRLARNVDDLRHIVQELVDKGVSVLFVKENLAFKPGANNPFDKLMLTLLGAFAEFERALIRERQREGIALAKQRGVYKGRPFKLDGEQLDLLYVRVDAGEEKASLAKEFGISRQALYRYLAQRKA